jgi:hypothetical protein
VPHRRDKTSVTSHRALALWSLALGLAGAAAFASWRAAAAEAVGTGERLATFGGSLLWPGALILLGIGAIVWMGWKISLD